MSDKDIKMIAGIDLGTTYSCFAYVDETGRAMTIKNSEGDLTTPSVVAFEESGNVAVGKSAKAAMEFDAENVVAFMKRNIGDGVTVYPIGDKDYRPEEVSALLLKRLAQDAGQYLQREVTDVVITVPAYFGENETVATKLAGEIAGLNVHATINEPTAAAIFYGLEQEEDHVVLVYDLGGGTFDVTMIEVKDRAINVICTGGDDRLGGKDWDEKLMNYLAEEWAEETNQVGENVLATASPDTVNTLRNACERWKQELSQREMTRAMVQIEGERAKIEITREKFEEITADLMQKTIDLTKDMLDDAKKKGFESFDKILLVGGSTRMPQVENRLKDLCDNIIVLDPDEAVAKGAALYGLKLSLDQRIEEEIADKDLTTEEEIKEAKDQFAMVAATKYSIAPQKVKEILETKITNVTSKAFGVVALNEQNQEEVVFLIHRNQDLPADTTMPFGTHEANQVNAELRVMEGEDESVNEPDRCSEIGQALIDLPAGLPAQSRIEVNFVMNEQGILEATGTEATEGRMISVTIDRGDSVMTTAEVEASSKAIKLLDVS